jgi:neopullulanase
LYHSLVTDYLYADPYNLMIMFDNHDITRYAESVKNDVDNYKLALSFLLTTRGIPQLYYGTEIMMEGSKSQGDGDIRRDFPGGWKEDSRNAFTKEGRTAKENDVFNHASKLLNWRKNNPVAQFGKMTHFVPEDNIYVYFRYDEQKRVMIILNNNRQVKSLKTGRFSEMIYGYSLGTDVLTGKKLELGNEIQIEAKSALILELQ